MTSHRLSMSKLALAHGCAWSFRADSPQHPRPSGREARIGSIVHKMAEAHVAGVELYDSTGHDPLEWAEAQAMFSAPLRAFLDSTKWTACEIGLRYDSRTDTTTKGPRRGEPGYEDVADSVLPGTLDLVELREDCVDVIDLKSGKLVQDREQLYGQAVSASRYFGASKARVAYVYARKTKCDPPQWEELDADALDYQAGRIAKLLRRLPMAAPVPGDGFCWKCDSRPNCPAFGEAKAEQTASELEAAGFFT